MTREEDGLVLVPLTVQEVEPGAGYEVRTGVLSVSLVHYPGIEPQQHLGEDPGDLPGLGEGTGGEEPVRL